MRRSLIAAALAVALVLVPSPPPAGADASARLAGADRYGTAAAVAHASFSPGVPVVYVATGAGFVDALVAGPAAAHRGGPVLLVTRDAIPASTAAELDRLNPAAIVVVGGAGAVSDGVVASLRSYTSGAVTRVSGADRYASAAAVSRAAFPSAPVVYVAGSERFSDALAGAPAAHREGAPLLLVAPGSVPSATADEIRRLGASRVVILGGTASVSDGAAQQLRSIVPDVVRVASADRYETSASVALRAFPGGARIAYIATGAGYADALASGPAAALAGGPVLLARGNCIPPSVNHALVTLRPSQVVLLGGTGVLYTGVERLQLCPFGEATLRVPTVVGRPGPVWSESAPDPDLVRVGSTWFSFATGSAFGNHISVLTSDRPDGGWRTITGRQFGSSALPNPPSWQTPHTQWAPGVYPWRGRWVMFYAARVASHGKWCITVAVASQPQGPYTDSSGGPMICQLDIGGSIDPQPFVDADGRPWLHWKNNDGSTPDVSRVWAAPLDLATGTAVAGRVVEVMAKNTQRYTWQSTLDNPQMVLSGGLHYLFYASGDWQDDTYRTGYAICASPVGPCRSGDQPILQSYGDAAGPAGGTVEQAADGTWWISYHAWHPSCTNDGCGGVRRPFVASLEFR